MAKYTVICPDCGTEWTTQLFGKGKDRDWKLDHFDWTCEGCKEKASKANNEKNAHDNQAAGLPALEGSEKQIAWAETIRAQFFKRFNEFKANAGEFPVEKKARAELAEKNIINKKSSYWWIERRMDDIRSIFKEVFDETELTNEKEEREKAQKEEAELIQAAKQESTVLPSKPVTSTVAEITYKDNTITISFPEKRDDFRAIVKLHKYNWNDGWKKKGNEDAAAQIGHILLSKGFAVRIYNEEIRQKAVNGNFKAENYNKISKLTSSKDQKFIGWLAISWNREIEDFYQRARKIKGSRWASPFVVVPPENYEEVQDFAQMYKFDITEAAQAVINSQLEAKEKMLRVEITTEDITKKTETKNTPVLSVPEAVEVADELKD